jgi:Na+-transporting methylmalonyl-CoA/oxaloacetate decarboxylase beta subunit
MTTAAAGESGFPAASALVYRDRHETSLTLLVLGVVITASMVAQIAWPDGNIVGAAWQMGVALTIAFAVLWLAFRRRAARHALKASGLPTGCRTPSGRRGSIPRSTWRWAC